MLYPKRELDETCYIIRADCFYFTPAAFESPFPRIITTILSNHIKQGFNRTTDSNKIEDIVLDDQKSRELRRSRTTRSAVYLYDVVNKYT